MNKNMARMMVGLTSKVYGLISPPCLTPPKHAIGKIEGKAHTLHMMSRKGSWIWFRR